jgi:hypothetical protein
LAGFEAKTTISYSAAAQRRSRAALRDAVVTIGIMVVKLIFVGIPRHAAVVVVGIVAGVDFVSVPTFIIVVDIGYQRAHRHQFSHIAGSERPET